MAAAHTHLSALPGIPPPATDAEALRLVEQRLDTSIIGHLVELGLERAEIDASVIPSRTLQHRRSRHEKLSIEESDRVVRILRVVSAATDLYGARERALAWLRQPNPRLDNRTPISLLKTDTGSRIVEELLLQIAEGIYV
ncbi:MAG: DUF2384 domain-containing protein [Acidobacteriota bacterium]|nr:DUF2384 domain-containing protein [Acidobacteriota bacterium]